MVNSPDVWVAMGIMGIMARRGSNFDSGPKRAAPPGSALGTPPPKDHGHMGGLKQQFTWIWPWKIGFWDSEMISRILE